MKNHFWKKVCCLATVMITVIIAACGGSPSDETRENQDTSGEKVKSVISKQTQYNFEDGAVMSVMEYEYDKEGNRVQTIQKDGEGNTRAIIKPEYNAEGKVVKEVTSDADGNVTAVSEYAYEDDTHYTITYSDTEGNILYAHKYEYDDKGSLTKLEMNFGDMVNVYFYENEYEGDKLVKLISYYQGEENGYTEYTYDEKDNPLKTINYSQDGMVTNYTEYICDADGNLSGAKSYTFDKLTVEMEYTLIK